MKKTKCHHKVENICIKCNTIELKSILVSRQSSHDQSPVKVSMDCVCSNKKILECNFPPIPDLLMMSHMKMDCGHNVFNFGNDSAVNPGFLTEHKEKMVDEYDHNVYLTFEL